MIRVIRILEYTYPTLEDYLMDKQHWTLKSPSYPHMSMRSVSFDPDILDKESE